MQLSTGFLILLICAMVSIVGCTNAPPAQVTTTIQTSVQTTPIPTRTSSDSFVMPSNPDDVTEQNAGRVIMDCKDEKNLNNYYPGYSTTPVCIRAYNIYTQIYHHLPPNPFEATAQKSYELLQCLQGMRTLDYCYSIADKNGMTHEIMKSSWCRTNTC